MYNRQPEIAGETDWIPEFTAAANDMRGLNDAILWSAPDRRPSDIIARTKELPGSLDRVTDKILLENYS